MLKIGLTGNIASGKSEVEKILSEMGYSVYDLDIITHELYNEENIKKQIINEFNTLDRSEIAKIVFSNKNKLKHLETIIHPELKKFILNLKSDEIVFISGALIYEAGFDCLFDKIIFVDSSYETRFLRLKKRNNLSDEEAKIRMDIQNPDNKSKADFIIENNSTIDSLKKQVTETLEKITN